MQGYKRRLHGGKVEEVLEWKSGLVLVVGRRGGSEVRRGWKECLPTGMEARKGSVDRGDGEVEVR